MIKTLLVILGIVFVNCVRITSLSATERIDITEGVLAPVLLGFYPTVVENKQHEQVAETINTVLAYDLLRSTRFQLFDARETNIPSPFLSAPPFPAWQAWEGRGILAARISPHANQVSVEYQLWDIALQKQALSKRYTTTSEGIRRVAHLIADEIYAYFTHQMGYFDTRIAYIAAEGPPTKRIKKLMVMDQDGFQSFPLTDGRCMALTPRFGPKPNLLLYVSYCGKVPHVVLRNTETQEEKSLGQFTEMTFSPRFSPKGDKVAFSLSHNGNSDIYEIDIPTHIKTRLTTDPALDVSPSYSPDQRQLVWNSNRSGTSQLYVMVRESKESKRISFGKGAYRTPVWSPNGQWIAFTKLMDGLFHIGIMRPDGSDEQLLSSSYLEHGPEWSPNGQVLIFTREFPSLKGNMPTSRLYTVSPFSGLPPQELPTPTDASDPSWSVKLQ